MDKDLIYYFDKLTYKRYELGEIQSGFNMSLVIDGTKDSCKVNVLSFIGDEIEPFTIVQHSKTNTWWIVSSDKVERYANEKVWNENTSSWEQTFFYIHDIELFGAIELFNARDLTDCGFNDNTYTISEFLTRLRKLSTLEFTWQVYSNISLTKKVDFVKTFENYTLLSALREFLDAYNSCAKLTFNTRISGNNVYLDNEISQGEPVSTDGIGNTYLFDGYIAEIEIQLDDIYDPSDIYSITGVWFISGDDGPSDYAVVDNLAGQIIDSWVDSDSKTWLYVRFTFPQPFINYITGGLVSVYMDDTFIYLKSTGIACNLYITQKTGDNSLQSHTIEDFENIRETKTVDKSSFGTCVVSNAENVISSTHKTYPAIGSVKMSSTEYYIVEGVNLNNAVIRLPSKVYRGNWIKIIYPLHVELFVTETVGHTFHYYYERTQVSFNKMVAYFRQKIIDDTGNTAVANEFVNRVDETLKTKLDLASCITIYNDNKINAYTGEITKGDNVPYLANLTFGSTDKPVCFVDKDTKSCLKDIKQGIAWERGSDLITGLDMFDGSDQLSVKASQSTDFHGNNLNLIQFTMSGINILLTLASPQTLKYVYTGSSTLASQLKKISFIVDYNPIADLKIKVDNDRDKRDIQLYNQNGRLTDNVALSKLLNSYSKEISSNNITKYMHYYSFEDVPKVGSFVYVGNEPYVVNNVSMTFNQNENTPYLFGYFIDAEITISKYKAVKSLMINPNTNIRDYGIPQNFNVKRKQLYRDYYELSYIGQTGTSTEEPYLPTVNIFSFYDKPIENKEFIAVMKIGYSKKVDTSYQWYYQLDTTNYYLNKMLYVVLEIQDNNIIGYGSQNVFSGFDLARIIGGMTDTINSPISYTDSDGKVKSFDIAFTLKNDLARVYDDYQIDNGGENYEGVLYNYSVFVPKEIYEGALQNCAFRITETSYNKDAIEVPVFEYACQIEDSEDVLIGDNVLNEHPGFVYFYSYKMAGAGATYTQDNVEDYSRVSNKTLYNVVKFYYLDTIYGKQLHFEIYDYCRYDSDSETMNYHGSPITFTQGRDYAIFRHAKNFSTGEEIVELMFIIRNLPSAGLNTNERVSLKINYYKLK